MQKENPRSRKAITVRIPQELYRETSELAQARGISLNHLLLESLERRLELERQQQLYDAFTLLGEQSVESYFEAQAEIVNED